VVAKLLNELLLRQKPQCSAYLFGQRQLRVGSVLNTKCPNIFAGIIITKISTLEDGLSH
jgi:hypothetical protein